MNNLFVGKEFENREEAKATIKAHAVETRRQISIAKNDNVRVRAKCLGIIPKFGDADMGSFRMTKQNGITINEGGKHAVAAIHNMTENVWLICSRGIALVENGKSCLPCKHAVAAIHNMTENGMNVGLP